MLEAAWPSQGYATSLNFRSLIGRIKVITRKLCNGYNQDTWHFPMENCQSLTFHLPLILSRPLPLFQPEAWEPLPLSQPAHRVSDPPCTEHPFLARPTSPLQITEFLTLFSVPLCPSLSFPLTDR